MYMKSQFPKKIKKKKQDQISFSFGDVQCWDKLA